mmetsp:Transcript_98537/g.175523  ORF Transcript_98537/g.175523 Transcript_98537/m.175523 type:complete len:496 (+) Transcript_98537:75-1562(+)|eukprot:CAMPEP_0197660880 /NCGR_PEP_ID=MMETSP1338-20131121/51117_1 /TAXON_ID=43686 ORGANISM="Pelagodinium beii, Strain RCC1491" /NCGR_SAMPLE_ID=MMETSP1338 /ASSEMBLY_ACC=CAM_ASM_000754 /LENGTH=495 /DNA_ID=CAMNT_0043238327 /DNA_START=47 /DNA_END=1534 /DNA_ORIENTATION=+
MTIGDIDYREYYLPETIKELHAAFDHYDSSGDGLLSVQELYQMFKKLGKQVSRTQLQQVLKEVDSDNNGEIDFEELVLLEIKMSGARPRADLINFADYLAERQIAKLENVFVQHDKSNTQRITIESLRSIVEQALVGVQEDRKPTQDDYDDVFAEVDPYGTEKIDFSQLCCAYAILTKARKRINYREYIDAEEVDGYRQLFNSADKMGRGCLSRNELDRTLKKQGLVLQKHQLKALFADFDADGSGDIDFEEFAVMMLRIRGLRRSRIINETTCTCEQLWNEEHFTVKELQQSGFGLEDFRKAGIPVGLIHRDGEFTGLELRRAGYGAKDLRQCGISLAELRSAGFSLTDLRLAGYSAAALEGINRSLHGSLSVGDLSVLPQRCPKTELPSKAGLVLSSAGFQLMKDASKTNLAQPCPWVLPARQMTPMIREHTDWRPRLRETATKHVLGMDALDMLVEASDTKVSTFTRKRTSDSNGFILDENLKFRHGPSPAQ